MPDSLVRPLWDGPLDVVGDVHGDIDALIPLLGHLGYDPEGVHPDGRRLVFVGDLTDRGPDSPAVIELVQNLVDNSRAQCVLGNHDLSLLLGKQKPQNGWFFGEVKKDNNGRVKEKPADNTVRTRAARLIRKLPIALERDDLRVVHACWDDAMIGIARQEGDVKSLHDRCRQQIEEDLDGRVLDKTDRKLELQNRNPVKLLTSGPEERSVEPVTVNGKDRFEKRVQWWSSYEGTYCVFGHYALPGGRNRASGSSFCIDYAVGMPYQQESCNEEVTRIGVLAALRHPEMQVVFQDGSTVGVDDGMS